MDLHHDFFQSSEVGALLLEHDWSVSPLGDPTTWPQSLRCVVQLMLSSEFPMFVAWGPDLSLLYNDAYAEILGDKHPQSLGARFQDTWREVWTEIKPVTNAALKGQPGFFQDRPFVIDRSGHPEKAWFSFSYAPVLDDQGIVAGVFCTVVETTRDVRDRRLGRFQLTLTDKINHLTSPEEIVATAVEMLAGHLNALGCWYAEIDEASGMFHNKNGWFEPNVPELPKRGRVDDFSPSLLPTLNKGQEFVCNDVTTDLRTRDFADRYLALAIGSILIVPVLKNGQFVFSINISKRNAYVWTVEDIQAARHVLDRTWVAMENAATQQRLKVERDHSDHILNQMGEGFMLVGPDWRTLKINTEGLRLLQRPAEHVLGVGHRDLWPEHIAHKVEAAYKDVTSTGAAAILELDFPSEQTEDFWWEMRVTSLQGKGLAVFFRNVTAQKRAALALRRSEEHLAALFEQTAAGIAEHDLQGRLVRVNERLCTMLGRPREEALGVNIHDLTHPDDLERSEAAFQKLLIDGQPFDIEQRYLQADGAALWVNTTVSLIRRADDHSKDSVLAVILDIDERKQAEDALRDETRVLELLNESGQSIAANLDLETLLQAVTDSGCALTGAEFGAFFYHSKNASGDALLLYTLSGAPREAFDRFGNPRATPVFKPTFGGEPAIRSDDITKDPRYGKMAPHHGMPEGHLPVRSYLAAPVTSRSGEVIGGLFFGHPEPAVFNERAERLVTGLAAQAAIAVDNARLYELSQKAAEERQARLTSESAARAEAERLNRSKDEFLAMLAHELRNPLAPVSAAAEVLRLAGSDAVRVRQASDIISRQIGHFTRLIDDLMDVSRVTRGLIQLEIEPLDLKSIISIAIEQARPMIEAGQHSLSTRLEAEHTFVNGDRTRLVQVVANLLTNAAKYTPARGEITLKVETDSEFAKIIVTDNGNGMDASLLPHVFDLFTQGRRGLDRSQGGLGIGLALVKAIVTQHQGRVQALSDGPGLGSSFTVTIPLINDRRAQSEDKTSVEVASRNLSILVVDDNIDAANSLAMLLKMIGHQVTVSSNAADAMNKAQLEPIDVFILDIGMPDMSGYDLARALRQHPNLEPNTYIALTGYGQPQDRQLSKEAGFAHHFVKPVNTQQLSKVLDEIASASA